MKISPIRRSGTASLSRRSLVALMAVAVLGAPAAYAQTFSRPDITAPAQSDPAATITRLNASLLVAMKAGGHASFNERFQALAPAIDRIFDLPAVLSVSVGPSWAALPADQQSRLLDAFRRYTVASYVASFNNYNGQSFSVSPQPRALGSGRVVVQTRITPVDGDGNELDYVMQQTSAGWKVVDVLAAVAPTLTRRWMWPGARRS